MLRLTIFAISFAVVYAVNINHESKSAGVKVIFVDNIDEYIAQHPDVKLMEKLGRKFVEDRGQYTITYTLGKRVNGELNNRPYHFN